MLAGCHHMVLPDVDLANRRERRHGLDHWNAECCTGGTALANHTSASADLAPADGIACFTCCRCPMQAIDCARLSSCSRTASLQRATRSCGESYGRTRITQVRPSDASEDSPATTLYCRAARQIVQLASPWEYSDQLDACIFGLSGFDGTFVVPG